MSASAATYYVDKAHPSSSDSNLGTESAPLKTIQRAANLVRAGDTVLVKSGTYSERVTFSSSSSGEAGDMVTFRAIPRRTVTMNGFDTRHCDHLRIEGFRIGPSGGGPGVNIRSNYVEVVDNHINDRSSHGISADGPSDTHHGYIANNYIIGCQFGISISGDDYTIIGNEVTALRDHPGGSDVDYGRFFGRNQLWKNNYFHGTQFSQIGSAHLDGFQTWSHSSGSVTRDIHIDGNIVQSFHQGVMMSSSVTVGNVRNIYITNNVFLDSRSWAVSVKEGCTNIVMLNNIFANCITHTVGVRGNSTATLKNNILYNSERLYWVDDTSTINHGKNLYWNVAQSGSPWPNDINANPKFVNFNNLIGPDGIPFTSDDGYRPMSDSPLIDAGVNSGLGFDEDIYGNARPAGFAYDIGPVETNGAVLPPDNINIGFVAPTATVNEGDGSISIAIYLSRPPGANNSVQVNYATENVTAHSGSDYTAVTGTLNFASNQATKTIVIPIIDDMVSEQTETFRVRLSNPVNGFLLANQSVITVSIIDNDNIGVGFASQALTVSEGAGTVSIMIYVVRPLGSSASVQVDYATEDNTAHHGSDYSTRSGTLNFASNELLKSIVIPIINDTHREQTETFRVRISNPVNGFLLTNQSIATVTIIDDDLDSDNDGISDADELSGYFGPPTNPFAWDSDGDGISDLTEIVLGTDPNDSSSFPSLSTTPLPFFKDSR